VSRRVGTGGKINNFLWISTLILRDFVGIFAIFGLFERVSLSFLLCGEYKNQLMAAQVANM
jgi:hypothetical protein